MNLRLPASAPALSPCWRVFATHAVLASLVVLGAGCAASGTKIPQAHLQQFRQGVATYYDVVAAFGAPQSEVLHADGSRQVVYTYTQEQDKWQNVVPVVARIAAGRTSEYTQAILLFDPRGVLTSYTWSGGSDKSGYGLDSGKKQ